MMDKKQCFGFLIILSILLLTIQINASYYAECELQVKIVKVLAKPKYNKKFRQYAVKSVFKIIKVNKGSGHNPSHCKDYEGTSSTADLLFKSMKMAKDLRPGTVLKVIYSYASGEGVDGKIKISESWQVVP